MIEEIKSHADKLLKFLLEIKDIKSPDNDWDAFSDLLEEARKPLLNDNLDEALEVDYRFFLTAAGERSINYITEEELKSAYDELAEHFK